MSMKPGATIMPEASRRRAGWASRRSPISTMLPSFHANVGRDAGRAGAVDDSSAADHEVDHCADSRRGA